MTGTSAGYASDAYGWRSAFLLLGIPGIVLAALLITTVTEPKRGRLDSSAPPVNASLLDTLRYAACTPAMLHCLAGATVFTLWAWGLMWWAPSYLIRSHRLTLSTAAGELSLMHGVGGTIVLLSTTLLMSRQVGRDARIVPWFVALTIAMGTLPSIVAFSTRSTALAIAMLWVFIPLTYATFGPTFAMLQNLVPPGMRAQSVALLLFFSNIANLVIAPQLIGIASDHFSVRYGAESLRIALVPLACTGFWAAWHYWMCARYLKGGLKRAGIATIEAQAKPSTGRFCTESPDRKFRTELCTR
jgi:MFS transporter